MNKTEEIWKPVKGYEGRYEVSNQGRVKSLYGWNGHRPVKREYITGGYLQKMPNNYSRKRVCLVNSQGKRSEVFIHRIVAEAFVNHPKGCNVVNHKDFNPLNNRADNLEWVTDGENHDYSTRAGRRGYYTNEQRRSITRDYMRGVKTHEIYEKYGGSYLAINRVIKEQGLEIDRHRGRKYNINLDELLSEFKEGKTNAELAEKYGCSGNLIARRRYQFRKGGIII